MLWNCNKEGVKWKAIAKFTGKLGEIPEIKKFLVNFGKFLKKYMGFSRNQVEFLHLPSNRSNLAQFSNFFFLQKAYENRHLAKYWVRNCAPCAPASAAPVYNCYVCHVCPVCPILQFSTNPAQYWGNFLSKGPINFALGPPSGFFQTSFDQKGRAIFIWENIFCAFWWSINSVAFHMSCFLPLLRVPDC